MKLFVYSYRTFDEDVYFREFSKEYGVELGICHQGPSMENAHLAEGYDYISILTSKINTIPGTGSQNDLYPDDRL